MTMQVGNYFPGRHRPRFTAAENEIVRRFHELYYGSWLKEGADTINLSWFGY
jgi:hypothetical protein